MNWLNALEYGYADWSEATGWPTAALIRLGLAGLLGAVIGLEREHNGHEAGFRTYALVCLGCALAMIVSVGFARVDWWAGYPGGESINIDPARVAYGVMGGIGFLGAGSIIQSRGHIRGLTTAAGIWCAAAVGLSVGLGQLVPPVATTLLILLLLYALNPVGGLLPRSRSARVTLSLPLTDDATAELQEHLASAGLSVRHADIEAVDADGGRMRVCALIETSHADLSARVIRSVADRERWSLKRLKWIAD